MTTEQKIQFIKDKREEKYQARLNNDHITATKLEIQIDEEMKRAGFDSWILSMDEQFLPKIIKSGFAELKNNRQSI
jgi:hypothetical protein